MLNFRHTVLVVFLVITSLVFFKKTQANSASPPNVSILSHTGGASYAIAVDGTYAYIGEGPRITSVDISNPANPLYIASSIILSDTVREITISGTYAYVADGAGGLFITDISDPAIITVLGRYNSPGTVTDVKVQGNYAYLADQNSLKIMQISNPTNPVEINSMSIGATRLAISGNLLYVIGGSLPYT